MCGNWGAFPAQFVLLAVWLDQTRGGPRSGGRPSLVLERGVPLYIAYKRFRAMARIGKTQTTGFISHVGIDGLLVTLALLGFLVVSQH